MLSLFLATLIFAEVQQDVQAYDVRIADNLRNVDRVSQELEYITNSNANMQKRMDRIEGTLILSSA